LCRLAGAAGGDWTQKEDRKMAAHAGETARETGDFRCEKCHQQTHVTKGDKIPKCPNCGNDTFDTRYHEPGNKS
jgi:ribosomal protein L37AE/L43A